MNKHRGGLLITAMIMMVAVTAVAGSLMCFSTIDLNITNAAQVRSEAETILIGQIQKIIKAQGGTSYNK
ncbi:pilus assembly protein PilX, partial [Pseudoalteromonas phenolica]